MLNDHKSKIVAKKQKKEKNTNIIFKCICQLFDILVIWKIFYLFVCCATNKMYPCASYHQPNRKTTVKSFFNFMTKLLNYYNFFVPVRFLWIPLLFYILLDINFLVDFFFVNFSFLTLPLI